MATTSSNNSDGARKGISDPQPPCYLQQVPTEIRLEIFRHLLTIPSEYSVSYLRTVKQHPFTDNDELEPYVNVYYPASPTAQKGANMGPLYRKIYNRPFDTIPRGTFLYPQILATCRLFSTEGHEILLTDNTFHLKNPSWFTEFDVPTPSELELHEMCHIKSSTIRHLQVALADIFFGDISWTHIYTRFPVVTSITGTLRSGWLEHMEGAWWDRFLHHVEQLSFLKRFECAICEDSVLDEDSMLNNGGISEQLVENELPIVPNKFDVHRKYMRAMHKLFQRRGIFQGDDNCWEWEFETVTSFKYSTNPQSIAKMIFNRSKMIYSEEKKKKVYMNPAAGTVLCKTTGDYGHMSRVESLD
ncbi:hypothetical protein BT63DRAFT_460050 [Microthyrium microscopicum]|uniref:Uncharacterized protein n=1 Tax=Microthyrium microscopicum TaxID=703497 RepID=A0A6A6TXX3_9PEZI|nr:hypothetical protein BT63DRAFT_460050 [Microthyrium microscopicum]